MQLQIARPQKSTSGNTGASRYPVGLDIPPGKPGEGYPPATVALSQSSSVNSFESGLETTTTFESGSETTTTFTDPLDESDRNPEQSAAVVVTPAVEIKSSQRLSSAEKIKITIPQSAVPRRQREVESTLPVVPQRELYRLIVKRRSVEFDGTISAWEILEEVQRFQGKVVVCVDSLTKQSVFIGIAQSHDGGPIGHIVGKRMEFWVVSSPYLNQRLVARAIVSANAFSPSGFEQAVPKRIRCETEMKLLEGPSDIVVHLDKELRVTMSTCDESTNITFRPSEQIIQKEAFYSSDAFYSASFFLLCEDELMLKLPYCQFTLNQLSTDACSSDIPLLPAPREVCLFFGLPQQDPKVALVSVTEFLLLYAGVPYSQPMWLICPDWQNL